MRVLTKPAKFTIQKRSFFLHENRVFTDAFENQLKLSDFKFKIREFRERVKQSLLEFLIRESRFARVLETGSEFAGFIKIRKFEKTTEKGFIRI